MSPSLVSVFGGATVLRASNLLVFQRAAHSPPGTTETGDKILHFGVLLVHGPRLCSWKVQMWPVCVQSLLHQRHTCSRWLVNSGIPLPFGNSKVKKKRSWKSKIARLVNIIHIWKKNWSTADGLVGLPLSSEDDRLWRTVCRNAIVDSAYPEDMVAKLKGSYEITWVNVFGAW